MEMLFTNMTAILAVIGALAFIVSVITQVFKGVGVLAKIPYGYPRACPVHRDYSDRVCSIYAVHPADYYLVHDSGGYSGGIFSCFRGDVRLGEVCRIMEQI